MNTPTNRHNAQPKRAHSTPIYQNILQWRMARTKYEYRLRQGAMFGLNYAQMCCGRDSDTAIKEIEGIIQFRLKEWERRNPKPSNDKTTPHEPDVT